jgi:beta-phosphoglucomutase
VIPGVQTTAKLRYEAVLFDVGGTLIGFVDAEPFRLFLEHAGQPAAVDDGQRLYQRFLSVIRAERDRAQGVGASEASLEAFWRSVFALVWPDKPELAAAMYRRFRENGFDRLLDDARPTLEALRAAGLRLGVISNWTGGLDALLTQIGVREYFEFVLSSAHVGMAKPDPRIFDLAAGLLGLQPDRLLYVGDHFGDDIQGARAAGLDAVLIDHGFRPKDLPCPRIRRLPELEQYVRCPAEPAEAILFDMDGVVLDSFATHLLAWQEALAPLGIRMTADDLAPLEGMPTSPMARLLVERRLGRPGSRDEVERVAATKRTLFGRYLRLQSIPDIVQLLHDLRGRGYRLGLVTGGTRGIVDRAMECLGVAVLFEVIVTSEDTLMGKPAPEPYSTAAARLGLAPSKCLAVENAPLGIQSARKAGMSCVALETTLPAERLGGAERVFCNVADLAHWLLSF